ncbi:MAG: hypothetical protein H0T42_13055 [Deltaproteobacteria bacterium]|nr:hypothetical protein [Deltaproteobacteria bacterium]
MIVVVACARLWRRRADLAIRRSSDSYVDTPYLVLAAKLTAQVIINEVAP